MSFVWGWLNLCLGMLCARDESVCCFSLVTVSTYLYYMQVCFSRCMSVCDASSVSLCLSSASVCLYPCLALCLSAGVCLLSVSSSVSGTLSECYPSLSFLVRIHALLFFLLCFSSVSLYLYIIFHLLPRKLFRSTHAHIDLSTRHASQSNS